jgi:predicted PurR-regulated permease PerM
MVLLALALVRYFEMGFQPAIVFFIVSNLVIYGPPELILRPYFVSVRSQIHPVVLLVVFLGGGFVGGIAGFFSAPIILGMLIAAYRVYTGSITETVPDADPSPGGTG